MSRHALKEAAQGGFGQHHRRDLLHDFAQKRGTTIFLVQVRNWIRHRFLDGHMKGDFGLSHSQIGPVVTSLSGWRGSIRVALRCRRVFWFRDLLPKKCPGRVAWAFFHSHAAKKFGVPMRQRFSSSTLALGHCRHTGHPGAHGRTLRSSSPVGRGDFPACD